MTRLTDDEHHGIGKFKLLYVGANRGKLTAQAQHLAERARYFTSIEITVVPTDEIERLKADLAQAREEIKTLSRDVLLGAEHGCNTHGDLKRCNGDLARAREELAAAMQFIRDAEGFMSPKMDIWDRYQDAIRAWRAHREKK